MNERRQPWHTRFEKSEVVAEEKDEMAKLREHYEARGGLVAREKRSPSAEDEKDRKKKKKKKKEKEKEKKPEKARSEKGETDEEMGQEKGQKSLRSLCSGTCLDPRVEERAKLLRRARRLGKKEGKKSARPVRRHRLRVRPLRMKSSWRRAKACSLRKRGHCGYPGSLGAQTIAGMKESLMTNSGTLHSLDRKSLPPLYTQYYRNELHSMVSPSMGQELLTISQTADLLLRGHAARAVDLLSQRFKALEQQARGAHWSVARQLDWCQQTRSGFPKELKEQKPPV